jgi:hypothetical protein
MRAGFFRYLSKPIKSETLTEAPDAALARVGEPHAPSIPMEQQLTTVKKEHVP